MPTVNTTLDSITGHHSKHAQIKYLIVTFCPGIVLKEINNK